MPDSGQDGKNSTRELTRSLVKADKMLQLAFMLPAAILVGWLIGAGLDLWLHQHWIYLAGILLGIAAGIVQIFRLMKEMEGEIDGGKASTGNLNARNLNADTKAAQDDRIQQEPK